MLGTFAWPFKWLVKLDKSDEPAYVFMATSYVQKLAGLHQVIDEKEEWPRPYALTSLKKDVLHEILEFTASKRKTLQGIMWEFVVRSTECLKKAQRKLCELELDWEEELFRKGWQPNMVHVKVCELRSLFLSQRAVKLASGDGGNAWEQGRESKRLY